MPGKKAPPTQLSSEARSSPSGVKSGDAPPDPAKKFPSFHCLRIWCCVWVTASTRLGSPAIKKLSPKSLGMDPGPERVVLPAGSLRKLKISSRVDLSPGAVLLRIGIIKVA